MAKQVLLKLTGKFLETNNISRIKNIALQIKELSNIINFSIVIGGGNFFRGNQQGKEMGLDPIAGHQVGMLATMMNGLILQDFFKKEELDTTILCALNCPQIGRTLSQQAVNESLAENKCIIFTGGTGNPFFTTDTTAVIRTLQIKAKELWKATDVDGIYNFDPKINKDAKFIKKLSYQEALDKKIKIMDSSAYILAEQNNLTIKVFNASANNCLIKASKEDNFGSLISRTT